MPCLLGGWSGTDLNAARLDKKVLERACAEAHKDFLPKFASLGPALQAEALDTAQDPNSQPPAKGAKSRSGKKAPAGRSPHIPTLPPPPPKRPRAENNTLNSLYKKVMEGGGNAAERAAVVAAISAASNGLAAPISLPPSMAPGSETMTHFTPERSGAEQAGAEFASAWRGSAEHGSAERGSLPVPDNLVGLERGWRESGVSESVNSESSPLLLPPCSNSRTSSLLQCRASGPHYKKYFTLRSFTLRNVHVTRQCLVTYQTTKPNIRVLERRGTKPSFVDIPK